MSSDPWRRQHNRDIDGCFGSGQGGYDKNVGKKGAKSIRYVECDMCISGKECRSLAQHRYNLRQAGRMS